MFLSQVLPLRAEPKIQTMFSGLIPVPETRRYLVASHR